MGQSICENHQTLARQANTHVETTPKLLMLFFLVVYHQSLNNENTYTMVRYIVYSMVFNHGVFQPGTFDRGEAWAGFGRFHVSRWRRQGCR